MGVRCGPWPATKAMERQEPDRFPDNVLYIYEKQLEEADLIVLNKTDLLSAAELADLKNSLAERFPDAPLLCMSARTARGSTPGSISSPSRARPGGRSSPLITTCTPRARRP